jgi:hypothetical protein
MAGGKLPKLLRINRWGFRTAQSTKIFPQIHFGVALIGKRTGNEGRLVKISNRGAFKLPPPKAKPTIVSPRRTRFIGATGEGILREAGKGQDQAASTTGRTPPKVP